MASPSWTNFHGGCRIFLRLLRGDVINSEMIQPTVLTRGNFRSDEDWIAVQDAAVEFEALSRPQEVHIPSRYVFEDENCSQFVGDLLGLVAGTHDPAARPL